jgi:hypothetical protein
MIDHRTIVRSYSNRLKLRPWRTLRRCSRAAVLVLVVVDRSSQPADDDDDDDDHDDHHDHDHGGRTAVGLLVLWCRHSLRSPTVTLLLVLRKRQGRERRPPSSAFLVTKTTATTTSTKQSDAVSEQVFDACGERTVAQALPPLALSRRLRSFRSSCLR